MPDSIREVLGERVARLGSNADEVLATAAVIGNEFGLAVLGDVTGMDEVKILSILSDAATAALVREVAEAPGRFQFTHALVQHAVLVNLGATREASLHRRVAEVLETGHEGRTQVAELAHHWLQATRRSDSAAGARLGPAGRRRRDGLARPRRRRRLLPSGPAVA